MFMAKFVGGDEVVRLNDTGMVPFIVIGEVEGGIWVVDENCEDYCLPAEELQHIQDTMPLEG